MYFPISVAVLIVFVAADGASSTKNSTWRSKECYDDFEYQEDGSCWIVSPQKLTWTQSRTYCEARRSEMLEIHSITEQNQAEQFFRSHSLPGIWLGGYDNKKGWKWISNRTMSFTSWAPNWPSFDNNELCMESLKNNYYKWSDKKCTSTVAHKAVCKYCPATTACRMNQMRGARGCCICRKSGYILLRDSQICVGQSGYNPYGQPEYIADGNPNTFMFTLPSPTPFVELDLPEPVLITGVTFRLRQDGKYGQKFCSREHDINITVTTGSGRHLVCGTYKGVKKDEPCSGRYKVVSCKIDDLVRTVRLQVSQSSIQMCSEADSGEYCVSDEVYMGEGLNVISLAHLEVLTKP